MLTRLFQRAQQLADAIAITLFIALFVVFIIQITARFAFNTPLPWTDELAVMLYTWTVLWGCAAVVRWREHVAFDAVVDRLPPFVQRVLLAIQALALGGLCAWALPASWDYVNFMARESTPVLEWNYRWVFMPFVLMMVAIVLRSAWQFWLAVKGEAKS
jgi:TRAP-type C4-dicarboxylate transport system permease small subunit